MTRVLYLNLYGTLGGGEQALLHLVTALDKTRYEPIVALGEQGPFVSALAAQGIDVVVEPFPSSTLKRLLWPWHLAREVRAAFRLRRLVQARGVSILHCGDVLGLLLLLPAALTGRRVLYQANYLGGRLRRLLLHLLGWLTVDSVVLVSTDQRNVFLRGAPLLAARSTVVYPGIEPANFRRGDGTRFRRELGLRDQAPLIGLVSRYDTWKGHRVFLDAAAQVLPSHPDAQFVMVGGMLNGESLPHVSRYYAAVMDRLEKLGLKGSIHVVGHRDDMPDVLAALDVLVCPSVHEPFGMVVIEAMAAGRPVVASDTGGPAEIIENGVSGLLFPTGNAKVLARHVLTLIEDPTVGTSLGEGGLRRVQQRFHRARYAREIEALYDRIA